MTSIDCKQMLKPFDAQIFILQRYKSMMLEFYWKRFFTATLWVYLYVFHRTISIGGSHSVNVQSFYNDFSFLCSTWTFGIRLYELKVDSVHFFFSLNKYHKYIPECFCKLGRELQQPTEGDVHHDQRWTREQ